MFLPTPFLVSRASRRSMSRGLILGIRWCDGRRRVGLTSFALDAQFPLSSESDNSSKNVSRSESKVVPSSLLFLFEGGAVCDNSSKKCVEEGESKAVI
jgi:hypothetical protein